MMNRNRQRSHEERHWSLLALIAGSAALGVVGTLAVTTLLNAGDRSGADSSLQEAQAVPTPAPTSNIRIRGPLKVRGTRNAPQPIVYVDGIRMDNADEGISGLDPDRIERVEVLKGEAAEALYGDEAANGIVQIFLHAESRDASSGGEETEATETSRDSR